VDWPPCRQPSKEKWRLKQAQSPERLLFAMSGPLFAGFVTAGIVVRALNEGLPVNGTVSAGQE
jgi:hypothetical protein